MCSYSKICPGSCLWKSSVGFLKKVKYPCYPALTCWQQISSFLPFHLCRGNVQVFTSSVRFCLNRLFGGQWTATPNILFLRWSFVMVSASDRKSNMAARGAASENIPLVSRSAFFLVSDSCRWDLFLLRLVRVALLGLVVLVRWGEGQYGQGVFQDDT